MLRQPLSQGVLQSINLCGQCHWLVGMACPTPSFEKVANSAWFNPGRRITPPLEPSRSYGRVARGGCPRGTETILPKPKRHKRLGRHIRLRGFVSSGVRGQVPRPHQLRGACLACHPPLNQVANSLRGTPQTINIKNLGRRPRWPFAPKSGHLARQSKPGRYQSEYKQPNCQPIFWGGVT
jgi:hypothetical protein